MQGVTIASASTCAPILSTRLAFHSQTLTQQALEALSITKDPVVWLPLLQKPVSGTNAVGGSRTADSDSDDSSEGEADLENVELTHSVWGGQPRRQKARDYQGAAACAVRRGDLLYVIPVARDGESDLVLFLRPNTVSKISGQSSHCFHLLLSMPWMDSSQTTLELSVKL